jgi:hypothetical protein
MKRGSVVRTGVVMMLASAARISATGGAFVVDAQATGIVRLLVTPAR